MGFVQLHSDNSIPHPKLGFRPNAIVTRPVMMYIRWIFVYIYIYFYRYDYIVPYPTHILLYYYDVICDTIYKTIESITLLLTLYYPIYRYSSLCARALRNVRCQER